MGGGEYWKKTRPAQPKTKFLSDIIDFNPCGAGVTKRRLDPPSRESAVLKGLAVLQGYGTPSDNPGPLFQDSSLIFHPAIEFSDIPVENLAHKFVWLDAFLRGQHAGFLDPSCSQHLSPDGSGNPCSL